MGRIRKTAKLHEKVRSFSDKMSLKIRMMRSVISEFRIPNSELKPGAAGPDSRTTPGVFYFLISEKKNAFFSGVLMTVTGLIWLSTRPCETSISL